MTTTFLVAEQQRGAYRIHAFAGFEQFRLWARVNKPAHFRPPHFAHGRRLRPDVDHIGEFSEAMLSAVEQDARLTAQREADESAHRESFARKHALSRSPEYDERGACPEQRRRAEGQASPRIIPLGHSMDDLAAIKSDAASRNKRKPRTLRSAKRFLDWCTSNGIDPSTVPAYLGMSLQAWRQNHPINPFGLAAQTILERRDCQTYPALEGEQA